MGEVYRARDTKLQRDVALKILPEAFAGDAERLARFKREAQVLASLNHPHIAAIYGLEGQDGREGQDRSPLALVLELVEGPTLADRIARGPIPLDEALPIATQIAEALEAAHEKGIIHRDLKPANIKLAPDDTVKVLDFGLAKAMDPMSTLSPEFTAMPTITSPAMMTGVGTILGTAAYMSPEQAKGRAADKRSDVWAFGCVLYEMLTGRRAFDGEDVADTLANVLKTEPRLGDLPSSMPPQVRSLLQGCLRKDRKQRIADTSTALFLLREPHAAADVAAPRRGSIWRTVAAGLALALAAIGGAGAAWIASRPAPRVVTTLNVVTDAAHALTPTVGGGSIAISPDGRRVAYVGPNGTLILRSLDQLEPTVLARQSGGNLSAPMFSPDGQWVGYFQANGAVMKVSVAGGPSSRISRLDSGNGAGGTWLEDGSVVFATLNRSTGLLQSTPGSETFKVLTTANRAAGEADHLWPQALPGGRAVLFTILPVSGAPEDAQVAVYDFRTGMYKAVVPGGSHGHYVPSGHLVYSAGGVLRAIAFDLRRLEAVGAPVSLGTTVLATPEMAANFDISTEGTLVYVPSGASGTIERELVWISRDGREQPVGLPRRLFLYPRISPDGARVLLDIRDKDNDIWLWDTRRGTLTNLTRTPGLDRFPLWAPDGRSFVFESDRDGGSALYRQSVDGIGEVERLTDVTQVQQTPNALSPDGTLLFEQGNGNLMQLTLGAGRRVTPVLKVSTATRASQARAALSAKTQWLAYSSGESGHFEVYVRPFPMVNEGRMQVSIDGGVQPWWSRSGDELFYFTPAGALMSVHVTSLTAATRPAVVFPPRSFTFQPNGSAAATYDVAADGRLLMIKQVGLDQLEALQMVVVQNWFEVLKRAVQAK
jgi:serine/threonine-protein kinase